MSFWDYFLGALACGTVGGAAYFHSKSKKEKKHLDKLYLKKSYTPASLIKGIKNKETDLINAFHHHSSNEISGSVFLEGVATSGTPLLSSIDKSLKLISRIYLKEEKFSNDRLHKKIKLDLKKKLKKEKQDNLPFFYLKSYESNESCKVDLENVNMVSQLALECVAKQDEDFKLNLYEKVFAAILMFFDYLINFEGDPDRGIRGLRIGYSEKEYGIKLESFLTVFGAIVYDYENNTLRIDNPVYLTKNRAELFKFLKESISRLNVFRNIFGVIGAVSLAILMYRLWKMLKKNRRQ